MMDKHGIKSINPATESQYHVDGKYWSSKTLRNWADIKQYDVFDLR